MADIEVKALYGSVVEDDEEGLLFIGFAEGEDEDEPYVLFRQALNGGLVWFEISDESLGAEDAIEKVVEGPKGFEITLKAEHLPVFGFASTIEVKVGPECEDGAEAVAALREMLAGVWQQG